MADPVAATITYNVIEAAVAITAGTIAPSTVLIGPVWTPGCLRLPTGPLLPLRRLQRLKG